MKTPFKRTLLFSLFTVFSILSISSAVAGPGKSGGGNGVGNKLLDFYENEGTSVFKPQETDAYIKVLKPLLKGLAEKSPDAAEFLHEGFAKKKWLLEPKPLSEESCRNHSVIKVKTTIIACQNSKEIRVSQNWMKNANNHHQAGLLSHELLVFHMFDYAKPDSMESKKEIEANIREFNRRIFSNELVDADDFIQSLYETFPLLSNYRKFHDKDSYLKNQKASAKFIELITAKNKAFKKCNAQRMDSANETDVEKLRIALEVATRAADELDDVVDAMFALKAEADELSGDIRLMVLDQWQTRACSSIRTEIIKRLVILQKPDSPSMENSDPAATSAM